MVALADALYLCLARLGARVYFALVPGLANSLHPQPSSVRCSWLDFKLDSASITQEASETITALNLVFRELQLPWIQNLQDRRNFI